MVQAEQADDVRHQSQRLGQLLDQLVLGDPRATGRPADPYLAERRHAAQHAGDERARARYTPGSAPARRNPVGSGSGSPCTPASQVCSAAPASSPVSGTYTSRIPSPPPGQTRDREARPRAHPSGSVAGQGATGHIGQDVVRRGDAHAEPFVDQPERGIYIPVPAGVQGEQGHPVLEAVRHGPADQALHLIEVLVTDQQLAPHVQVIEAAVRAPGNAHRDAIGAEAVHQQIDLGVLFRLRPVLIRLRPVLTPFQSRPRP